ncbi:MAG: hypothetical protein ACKVS8_14540 [Phycisphaerales bacterium]
MPAAALTPRERTLTIVCLALFIVGTIYTWWVLPLDMHGRPPSTQWLALMLGKWVLLSIALLPFFRVDMARHNAPPLLAFPLAVVTAFVVQGCIRFLMMLLVSIFRIGPGA